MTSTVLMTADTVGGVWTYALELADALAPYDVRVHLATMGRPMSAEQRDAAVRSTVVAVHESRFALEWMPDPWADVDAAGEWLLDLAATIGPDVVHLNGYSHAVLDWPAPTVVVAHSDVLSWWAAVHREPAPAGWSTYRQRVAAGLAAADAVIAPTRPVLADLERWFGHRGGTVIPNCRGVPLPATPEKAPLVVASGRLWDEAKNLELLVRAAPRLPWPVVLAGEATRPDGAGDPAPGAPAAAGAAGPAALTGALPWPALADLLARASVFVAPARYEPFGLGALEAARAGCALVLGDIPSLREVWGDAATFVHPDDEDALVHAVTSLAADPHARAAAAAAAAARASSYRPERTARGYLEVYGRLPVRVGGRA